MSRFLRLSAVLTAAFLASSAGMAATPTLTFRFKPQGTPTSSAPCASDGPISPGFPAFRTNAQGQATVVLRADPAQITGTLGAYVNVHTDANLAVVPLCTLVLKPVKAQTARSTSTAAPTALQQTVQIGDNFFMPADLSVVAGTTVTWTHTGRVTHNVLSVDLPGLRSADLHPGESYRYTFKTPGTFTYYCSYHEGRSATITVTNR